MVKLILYPNFIHFTLNRAFLPNWNRKVSERNDKTFQINAWFAHSTNLKHLWVARLLTLMMSITKAMKSRQSYGKNVLIKFRCQLKLFDKHVNVLFKNKACFIFDEFLEMIEVHKMNFHSFWCTWYNYKVYHATTIKRGIPSSKFQIFSWTKKLQLILNAYFLLKYFDFKKFNIFRSI